MTTLSDAARAMGKARSARKAAAARINGKLGGRPRRKTASEVSPDLQPGCGCVIPASAPTPKPTVPAVLIVVQPKEGK